MQNFHYTILILALITITINVQGQNQYPTESETHIFWQPDRILKKGDFQGGNPYDSKFNRDRELGRYVVPCLGIFLHVDIPKNYRKNKKEIVYFAPAFQKSCSYILNTDSSNFRDAQIQFDIYELSTRIARKYIWEMRTFFAVKSDSTLLEVIRENPDTILITGIGNIFAYKARDSALNIAGSMSAAYFNDLYFNKDSAEATYEDWRILVDDLLEKNERFATKPEDCYRMINDKPILRRYKQAKR